MIRHRDWPSGTGAHGDDSVAITPTQAIGMLLRRWRLMIAIPVVTAIVAIAFAFIFRDYTARSRFVTKSSNNDLSRFAGIAAQIGISVADDGSQSPDFYVDLIGSSEVLRPTVLREYRFAKTPGGADTLSGTYLDLLEIGGETDELRIQHGMDRLRDHSSASASVKSGVVSLRTDAKWPGLAEQVNASILELLASFDRERRQAGARAEREFIETRLDSAKTDLNGAEAQLARFLERNARPESPRLMMEMERLQRSVSTTQQIYGALAQAYEQARIEEVRNTPVITIVDRPDGTARPGRSLRFVALMALVIGAVAAASLAFVLDWIERQSGSPAMEQLRESIASARRSSRSAGAGA
jgi:uncharacterized protein involved in exopolysaccharide biosynthesis